MGTTQDNMVRIGWSVSAVAFLLAFFIPVSLGVTPDVSWLLTAAERVLAGEVLYRDILEYNPPFSVWLYAPAAAASRMTGIASEIFLYAQFVALFVASFAATAAILLAGGRVKSRALWLHVLAWTMLFVLLPLHTFLQREHLAAMALMPWLALQVVRWDSAGFRPRLWMVAAGGLSCALIVIVKPYYVLTVLLPVIGLAARHRSIRPFFNPENLAGAVLAVIYGATVLAFYPHYLGAFYETLKVVYLDVRTPEADIFFRLCFVATVLSLALWTAPRRWPAEAVVLVLAAVGHLAGTMVMGRTFTYHALPWMIMLGFALLALIADARNAPRQEAPAGGIDFRLWRRSAAALVAAVAFFLAGLVFRQGEFVDEKLLGWLRDRHVGATYITLSPSFADSHPLVRLAGGTYLAPNGAMAAESWGSILIEQMPHMDGRTRARVTAEIGRERRAFADAILARRPDILLVARDITLGSNPAWTEISRIEADGVSIADLYEEETRIGDVIVFRRNPARPV